MKDIVATEQEYDSKKVIFEVQGSVPLLQYCSKWLTDWLNSFVFNQICKPLESSLDTEKYSVPMVTSVMAVWSEGPARQHYCT